MIQTLFAGDQRKIDALTLDLIDTTILSTKPDPTFGSQPIGF